MNEPTPDFLDDILREGAALKERAEEVELGHLIDAGLIRPPLQLEAKYTPRSSGSTHHLRATVEGNGSVWVNGRSYDSLSMAASMAQQPFHTKPQGHQKHEINGWDFWRFHDPDTGILQKMELLRARYVLRKPHGN